MLFQWQLYTCSQKTLIFVLNKPLVIDNVPRCSGVDKNDDTPAANPDIARAVNPICASSEVSYFSADVVPKFGPDFRRSDSGIVSEFGPYFDANLASVFSG